MKTLRLTILLSFIFNGLTFSQTQELVLKPNASQGKDALIWNLSTTTSYPNSVNFIAASWTWSGTPGLYRSLIEFDLTLLPTDATLISASLSLFHTTETNTQGQTGDNATFLQRITSPWTEETVNWNNQPSITTLNQVELTTSTSSTQNYLNIDVTQLVLDMLNNPSSSYGFMIKLQTESGMKSMKFASSDATNPALWPELKLIYELKNDNCFTFQPNPTEGIDARIWSNYPDLNEGESDEFIAARWTFQGVQGTLRSLLKFNLDSIPTNAIIDSAFMSLFWNNNTNSQGHSGDNKSYLYRIIENWNELTVTWNNQPNISNSGAILLNTSTSQNQDYLNIDVTNAIASMHANPSANFGFMLKLENESIYRSMKFCSSDYSGASKRPRLKVCYHLITEVNNLQPLTNKYQIGPNPFSNSLNISLDYTNNETYEIILFDALGREINRTTTFTSLNIPTENLPDGLYFVRLNTSLKSEVVKLVKGKF